MKLDGRFSKGAKLLASAVAALLVAATLSAQSESNHKKEKKPNKDLTTKLRLFVTAGDKDEPVGNASVYVRYTQHRGLLHKDKQVEMNLKTNQDGTVRVPDLPRRKVLIQVVAPGWKTYGKWYELDKEEEAIRIRLERPPHWY